MMRRAHLRPESKSELSRSRPFLMPSMASHQHDTGPYRQCKAEEYLVHHLGIARTLNRRALGHNHRKGHRGNGGKSRTKQVSLCQIGLNQGAVLPVIPLDQTWRRAEWSPPASGILSMAKTRFPNHLDPLSRPGDLWIMGPHRLLYGDQTDASATKRTGRVLNDDHADWSEAWALFPADIAYVWHGTLHAAVVAESQEISGFAIRSQMIWAKERLLDRLTRAGIVQDRAAQALDQLLSAMHSFGVLMWQWRGGSGSRARSPRWTVMAVPSVRSWPSERRRDGALSG